MQLTDIADLMQNVVLELADEARAKSLRVLTDIQREPLMIECDPNRMVQLFTNLLENAVRFSKKGGVISIHASSLRDMPNMPEAALARVAAKTGTNGFALIGISDSGPGIGEQHKERVFHTFHQANLGKKSLGESLGLGLAISRVVVEAHGGTIWVEDNSSGGAIFCVLLPRTAAKSESLAQAS
jgi:signal transduction histidine kinase